MLLKTFLGMGLLLLISNIGIAKDIVEGEEMQISEDGKKLIERFEGRVHKAYFCPGGALTNGIGHAILSKEKKNWKLGSIATDEQVDKWFQEDIAKAEKTVNMWVAVPLTQGQFDALVSFVFNLGDANFKRSTMLKMLNKGQVQKAADQLSLWVNSRSNGKMRKLAGLVARRAAERDLFLIGVDPVVA